VLKPSLSNSEQKKVEPIERIKHWCAYQERSAYETRLKLKTYGLNAESVDLVIAELISTNFLNEERFAKAFVSGKVNIKHWGVQKIKQALKRHQVSDYSVQKALAAVDGNQYEKELYKLLSKKLATLKNDSLLQKKQKLFRFGFSKGYETHHIEKSINELLNEV
jgi:regulatory protein